MNFWKSSMLLGILALAVLSGCSPAADAPQAADSAIEPPAKSAAADAGSPAPKAAPAEAPVKAPAPVPAPVPAIEVPAGTELSVILLDSLSSADNKAGDAFTTSLAAPLVVKGTTVLAKGTKLRGRVVDAEGSGRV